MRTTLSSFNQGWVVCSISKRLTYQNEASAKKGMIIFPNHGSQEMGKGLERKIRKDAGL